MREAFKELFRPTEGDFKTLWDSALFAFDASAVLNIYRSSEATRTAMLDLLKKLKTRLVIPYQFAFEFATNRVAVICDMAAKCAEAEQALRHYTRTIFPRKYEYPFPRDESIASLTDLCDEIASQRNELLALLTSDPYADQIMDAFEGAIGTRPTPDKLKTMHELASDRHKTKVPPGYADKKPEPDAYGDCVGWLQLIDIAKEKQRNVILVCHDLKEDWWQRLTRKGGSHHTIGPRWELREEFRRETGQMFYMYTSDMFLEYSNKYKVAKISPDVITEVRASVEHQAVTSESDAGDAIKAANVKPNDEECMKSAPVLGGKDDFDVDLDSIKAPPIDEKPTDLKGGG